MEAGYIHMLFTCKIQKYARYKNSSIFKKKNRSETKGIYMSKKQK